MHPALSWVLVDGLLALSLNRENVLFQENPAPGIILDDFSVLRSPFAAPAQAVEVERAGLVGADLLGRQPRGITGGPVFKPLQFLGLTADRQAIVAPVGHRLCVRFG